MSLYKPTKKEEAETIAHMRKLVPLDRLRQYAGEEVANDALADEVEAIRVLLTRLTAAQQRQIAEFLARAADDKEARSA